MKKEVCRLQNEAFVQSEEKNELITQIEDLRAQINSITNYMESDILPPIIRDKLREMELEQEALQEQYSHLQERVEHARNEKVDLHNALIELR